MKRRKYRALSAQGVFLVRGAEQKMAEPAANRHHSYVFNCDATAKTLVSSQFYILISQHSIDFLQAR
jgi:hypothetical protein